MIRLLLADDQVLFVNSLRDVLEMKDPELEVRGVVYNGQDAVEFLRAKRGVDVAILDIRMQPMDGVEAARIIHEEFPGVKIIMLTTFDDDAYVRNALGVGASGYLLKDMLPQNFIAAIKAVSQGSTWLAQSATQAMMRGGRRDTPAWFAELTDKERDALRLLSLGWNNEEISAELRLGKQTVKNYVHGIYDKMGVRDRMQAMRVCMEQNLFDED
jgi:DNA-binding NarL/FixJ family response regulator